MYSFLTDNSISWKAKGLLAFIIENNEQFENTTSKKEKIISQFSKEKIVSIRSGIKELETNNYLEKIIVRTAKDKKYVIGSKWKTSFEKENQNELSE